MQHCSLTSFSIPSITKKFYKKITYAHNKYLHCIKYFRMIHSDRRYRVSCILRAWNVKNSILPVTGLCFTISECVHPKALPSTLMPSSLIPVTIGKLIDPKAMHLVSKIFSSICIPISEQKKVALLL